MRNELFAILLLLSLSLTTVAQPVFVANTFSTYSLPSSTDYSAEEIILSSVGREVFSKLTQTELQEFKQLCTEENGPEKIAQQVGQLLDEFQFDYASACLPIQDSLRQTDSAGRYCSDVSRNLQCPIDEARLTTACKRRLAEEKKFIGWEEDDALFCETEFQRKKGELLRYCQGDLVAPGICPARPFIPEVEEKVKQECLQKGGTPYTDRCGFTACDFHGITPPVIIDPANCPVLSADWKRSCEAYGGKPSEEYRGNCIVPHCEFSNELKPPVCPGIAIPPGWEEQCRQRGGIPIKDDPYGCPRAECRLPDSQGRAICTPLPAAPADVLESLCRTANGGTPAYRVNADGCKEFYCQTTSTTTSVTCPEVPSTWYDECRRSGGTPDVKSDPYNPTCMQFYCSRSAAACPTSVENEQRSRECIANGGSVYYNYGQGSCPIVMCHVSEGPRTCPVDPFTSSMEQSCKQGGGTVVVQYNGACTYRFCQPRSAPTPEGCPVAHTCQDGSLAIYAHHDGTCPVFQCKEKVAPSCPSIPACPPNEHAEPSYAAGAANNCPTYTCKSNAPVAPTAVNTSTTPEYCPSHTPTACTGDQMYVSEPYAYTTPSGRSLTCYRSSCASPSSLPTCQSSCTSYTSSYVPTCSANQRLKSSYSTYTENGQSCKCETSKWCETNYDNLPTCSASSSCSQPQCGSNQIRRTSASPYTSSEQNGAQCKCFSSWCETDTSTLPVCADGPGCSSPVCSAGETLQTSGSPYSTTVNGVQCACTSKWCSSSSTPTPTSSTPGGPASSTACPYISPVTCSSNQVSTSELIPGYQNCYQQRCVDASTLPACTTTSCGSTGTPSCTGGQVVRNSYYSMQQNGQACRCQSQWCETPPELCASATCPTNTPASCSSGQVLRTTTSPYYPPGCSSNPIQCTSTWCETDQSQCASQPCPTYSPYVPTSCGEGYVQQTTTGNYYPPGCSASISCTQYNCVAATTAAPASATGLQVGFAQGTTQSSSAASSSLPDFCTDGSIDRGEFVRQCLAFRRGQSLSLNSAEGVDEICRREVSYNLPMLEKYCAEGRTPYDECRASIEGAKSRLESAYVQCAQLATRDKVLEIVKRKAEVECKKMSLSGDALKHFDQVLLTGGLTPLDASKAEIASNTIVLTQTELNQLKEEIKRDVLAQVTQNLAQALGLRQQQENQAALFKQQQADKLAQAAVQMREVCVRLEGTDRATCEAAAAEAEQQAQVLRNEAQLQQLTAGGLADVLKALAAYFK